MREIQDLLQSAVDELTHHSGSSDCDCSDKDTDNLIEELEKAIIAISKKEHFTSVENLPKWYVHVNKFGVAAGRVVGSKDLCDWGIKYEELVKFSDVMEIYSTSLQQLKDEVADLKKELSLKLG